MLPQGVVKLLATAFPETPIGEIAPTSGGFSHHTAVVTAGGQRWVVKAAETARKRADVRREARVLALLHGAGLLAPDLLTLVEDASWTAAVMGFVAGSNGISLYTLPPGDLEQIYDALARLLAAVHRVRPASPDPDLLLVDRAASALRGLSGLGLDADLREKLAAALAHPAWSPAQTCLVHGDAGLHNILWSGGITALLDWEWAGWGNPLLDLAWVCWTMRWRKVPDSLWEVFLKAYLAAASIESARDAATLRALALGQIALILARLQDQPAAMEEWLRRARWTLAVTFPDAALPAVP